MRFSCIERLFEVDWNKQMYADTGNLAPLSEIIINQYNHSKSQSLYLSNSGGVRISPSQSASNVKIRPRHMTTRWEGQEPSLSVSAEHKRFTTETCELWMWARGRESCEGLKSCLFNLFWSNYGWCPLWLQVLCRCSTAFWTGTCLTVCCQLSEGPASLLNKNREEFRLHFRFSLKRDI